MKRTLCLVVLLSTACLGAIEACSSSSSPNQATNGGDAGADVTGGDVVASDDSSPPRDGGSESESAADSPPSDSPAGNEASPSCLQLAAATQISTDRNVAGITTDGYVISGVADGGTDDTPLDGGPTAATGLGRSAGFAIVGPVVMVFQSGGDLFATWHSGVTGTGAPFSLAQAAVSSDGQYMISTGSDGSLTFSKTDMSGQVQLVPAPDAGTGACSGTVGFAGSYVVAATYSCTTSDAGVLPLAGTITSYALPSLTPATILTNAQPFWSADAAGTKIFAITAGGAASVFPIGGGAGTPIDTSVWSGFMTPDGANVVYATTSGQLKRAATTSPQPTLLVPSGVYDFPSATSWENVSTGWLPAQSPDGSEIMTCGSEYCSTGDVSFASTTTPGTTTTIVASGGLYGQDAFHDAFTHDGTYALVRTLQGSFFGASNLIAAKAGGTPKTLATASTAHFAASSGAKVIYDDNYSSSNRTSDLYVVDLASSCQSPTLIASGIHGFWVNLARDTIVYAKGAIYEVPVP